jgi:hypothetical protein
MVVDNEQDVLELLRKNTDPGDVTAFWTEM